MDVVADPSAKNPSRTLDVARFFAPCVFNIPFVTIYASDYHGIFLFPVFTFLDPKFMM